MLDSKKRTRSIWRSLQMRKRQCLFGVAVTVVLYMIYSYGADRKAGSGFSNDGVQRTHQHVPPLFDSVNEELSLLKNQLHVVDTRIAALEKVEGGASTVAVSTVSAHGVRVDKDSQSSLAPIATPLLGGQLLMLESRHFEASNQDTGVVKLEVRSEELMGGEQWTTAMWVRTSSGEKQTVLCVSPPGWSWGGRALIFNKHRLAFDMFNIGTFPALRKVADGHWHHVALTFVAYADKLKVEIFVDAVSIKTVYPLTKDYKVAVGLDVTIGGGYEASKGAATGFDGDIRRVVFWNKAALTAEQIKKEMSDSAPSEWRPVPLLTLGGVSSTWCPEHSSVSGEWKDMFCQVGPQAINQQVAERPQSHRLRKQTKSPVIAIGIPVTTRNIPSPSIMTLGAFNKMIPQMTRVLDEDFEYWFYLAHDEGDPFFGSADHQEEVSQWMVEHVETPSKARGITVQHTHLNFVNELKKPGPVFNFMMRSMYEDGADYLYRVNDDSMTETAFAKPMVQALLSMNPPNIGVVGPSHKGGNEEILTHDFVHRSHLDIFGLYYPTRFRSWYMDDWITFVYGKSKTKKLKKVRVNHATDTHGTRYEIDGLEMDAIEQEFLGGRALIIDYCERHGLDASSFRSDPVKFYKESLRSGGVSTLELAVADRDPI
jgi:hypothetical protein